MGTRYDDTGPEVDWFVKVGDPIVKTWLITDEDGAAVNVSAATRCSSSPASGTGGMRAYTSSPAA